MRSKLGIALDIFILVIGPLIIYSRIVDISRNGVSLYPMLSVIIISIALIFSINNLYQLIKSRENDSHRKN